uniref:C-C motif chemokine 25 n=1 Tax=Propithecus coquereli TaxID=379532 RepID=A0A2K6FKX9_PROCO
MNPSLLACLVACFVGAWAPAVHTQGVFEDCCLAYHRGVRWAVLRHAWGYQRQEVSGSCNLPAVIFHFRKKNRMVCGDPKNKDVQKAMRFLDTRKTRPKLRHIWMPFQGP